jgi:hypothetical protein
MTLAADPRTDAWRREVASRRPHALTPQQATVLRAIWRTPAEMNAAPACKQGPASEGTDTNRRESNGDQLSA